MAKRFKIGIDLGATRIKMAFVDDAGRVSYRREIGTPFAAKRDKLINILVTNVKGIIQERGIGGRLGVDP